MRTEKPMKIDFATFARLVSGQYNCVFFGAASLTYRRATRMFVFEGRNEQRHEIAYDHSDEVRLNAHWQQFAKVNA